MMFNFKKIFGQQKKKIKARRKNKTYNRYNRPTKITATLAPTVALELLKTCEYIGHKQTDFVAAAVENYILYYRGYIDDKEDGYV